MIRFASFSKKSIPALSEDGVHVWSIATAIPENQLQELEKDLSDEERARAQRYKQKPDSRRSMISRGLLRRLLSSYTGIPVKELQIRTSEQGKPELVQEKLHFNISHSGDQILLAFSRLAPLGVDVEQIRANRDMTDIVKRFFSKNEVRVWNDLPEENRQDAFFRCWTRKEAFLKALGEGLRVPLDRVEVSFASTDSPKILSIAGNVGKAAEWTLHHLEVGAGYTGALAIRASPASVKAWNLSEPIG